MCFQGQEPSNKSKLGPVELTVVIIMPVCVLSIVFLLAAYACQAHLCRHRKKRRPNIEEPLSECNLVNPGKSLKDLIFDMTTSGSGSGTFMRPRVNFSFLRCIVFFSLFKVEITGMHLCMKTVTILT